jgi:hypothetical protein
VEAGGKKSGSASTCFHAGFLLGLYFDREGEGNMFLRKVS